MKRLILSIFLFCIFLLGYTDLSAQWFGTGSQTDPYQISSLADLNLLASNVNAGTSYYQTHFRLMRDIAGPVTQMIGDDVNYFEGGFDGQNFKITLAIVSNNINVGLFSQFSATIFDLVLDGSVTGGQNSQNVGGLVGLPIAGSILRCINLAEVTSNGPTSSVGGIAGMAFAFGVFHECTNNGTITGGRYVAGIIGYNNTAVIDNCRNAGTIKSNSYKPHYMAGIVGKVYGSIIASVNIGSVLSSNSEYAGGIVAYSEGDIHEAHNSGVVDGAINSVGGIVGYAGSSAMVRDCINTNWIEGTATNSGAIAGLNNGFVSNCYYDEQMCILPGIGAGGGNAIGLPTTSMIGNNLPSPFNYWQLHPQLYPRTGIGFDHPISLLAAAPIYLQNLEKVDNVTTTPFYVSNWNPNLLPPPGIQEPFQWGWYPGGIFTPSSMMGYISIPLSLPPFYSNTATILVPKGGWDSLSVRLDYPNYNYPGFYTGYTIIFEKIVPLNVRP